MLTLANSSHVTQRASTYNITRNNGKFYTVTHVLTGTSPSSWSTAFHNVVNGAKLANVN